MDFWLAYQPTFFLAINCLMISIGGVSVICGIINLLMIYYMKVWNQFLLLVTNLAFSQLLFDISSLSNFCDPATNKTCYADVPNFIDFYMGIVVTLWTNVIITVLYSSIVNFKPNIVKDNYYKVFFVIHWFGQLIGVLNLIASIRLNDKALEVIAYFYITFRLASIVYNIVIILLLYRQVRSYNKNNPIFELIKRLIYYPVVQIVTFVPTTWFLYQYFYNTYEFNDDDYYTPTSNINTFEASSYLFSIFYYSAGIGFFIVFLVVTPNSYNFLTTTIKSCFCCNHQNNKSSNNNNNNNDNNSDLNFDMRDSNISNSVRDSSIIDIDFSRLSDLELTQMIIDSQRSDLRSVELMTITTITSRLSEPVVTTTITTTQSELHKEEMKETKR